MALMLAYFANQTLFNATSLTGIMSDAIAFGNVTTFSIPTNVSAFGGPKSSSCDAIVIVKFSDTTSAVPDADAIEYYCTQLDSRLPPKVATNGNLNHTQQECPACPFIPGNNTNGHALTGNGCTEPQGFIPTTSTIDLIVRYLLLVMLATLGFKHRRSIPLARASFTDTLNPIFDAVSSCLSSPASNTVNPNPVQGFQFQSWNLADYPTHPGAEVLGRPEARPSGHRRPALRQYPQYPSPNTVSPPNTHAHHHPASEAEHIRYTAIGASQHIAPEAGSGSDFDNVPF
ncbi:MAG: hypothetical protein M1818_002076 [Claussenomyces sp. TS43310]|nr:MAG: hypothetical protein M1818_002076 [Claussenomyces sp. TS43310]